MDPKSVPQSAFPYCRAEDWLGMRTSDGMDLRDWFAGQALTRVPHSFNVELMAEQAYVIADAMMKARLK